MRRAAFIAILTATATYTAYASGPSTVQVVSAASSAPLVSPDSLATIYGTGLSSVTAIGQLTSDGKLPTNIDGLSVLIDNQPAGLLYISPGQINVWIPPQVSTGTASVRIVQETNNVVGTGSVAIAQIAPA
ncbi:MAG TPA: IPT/TIG domain-containing protein, partial [Bryobacteraceae bacterium]|nr:IPT/TIG domain-containing protein [Bryobacteraceae bacterium]